MQQENGVFITCGAGTEKMNHESYSPNLFRPGDSPDARTRAQAKLMARSIPNVTRWTGLIPDHEYGRTTWGIFVDGLLEFYPRIARKKPEILDRSSCLMASPTIATASRQALRQQADGCFNATYGGDAITMFQQARGFGLMQRYKVVCDAANEFLVARGMKQQLPAQWTGMHYYAAANKGNRDERQFLADYLAKTKDRRAAGLGRGSALSDLRAGAADREGQVRPIPAAVIANLKGLTWDTVTGPRFMRPKTTRRSRTSNWSTSSLPTRRRAMRSRSTSRWTASRRSCRRHRGRS